jgi:ATP-dependent DNA helicase HFM1/MER3
VVRPIYVTASLAYSATFVSFSCHDGLSEPPAAPKKRNTTTDKSKSKPIKSKNSSSTDLANISYTIQSKTNRIDNTFQQFKHLHESAKDQKSIRIPDGQRLKLDNPALSSIGPSRRRPKLPPPNFKLTFADLSDSLSTSQYQIPVEDDDDDDLPDIHDLLNAPQAPTDTRRSSSSTSDYSNSEVDALIRDIPLEDFEAELADDSHLHGDLDALRPRYRPATPILSRKRPREAENEPPSKRLNTRMDTTERSHSPPIFQTRGVYLLCTLPDLITHPYFVDKATQGPSISRRPLRW